MKTRYWFEWFAMAGLVLATIAVDRTSAVENENEKEAAAAPVSTSQQGEEATRQGNAAGDGLIRLSPKDACWVDPKRKQVIIDGEVCLREGYLEMFACIKGTKEHESVVALNSPAYVIHAGLLAVGAKVGHPVMFRPSYQPAAGTEIEVFVQWRDEDGKPKQSRAQEWVRQVESQQAMPHAWVFAGSSFWTDPQTGRRYYRAEGGEVICVSNFPTAMLDLPIKSTQANEELLFEAFTEHIPPLGTKVRVVLAPKLKTTDPGKETSAPGPRPTNGQE